MWLLGCWLIISHRMIAVAVYALVIAHPGPVFGLSERAGYDGDDSNGMDKVTDKSANETALEEQTP